MSILVKILELFFSAIADGLSFLIESIELALKDDHSYKATFIQASSLLSSSEKGFCLTGDRNLSVKLSYQNAIAVGGTGTGKSSVTLIPSIYTMDASAVINDPSGELHSKTAGQLAQRGYIVKVLNFSKPESSCGYNPLQRTNTSSEIQKVATMLVENALGKNSKDPFWSTQAVALLSMLITILKKQEPQYQNPYNLRHLLNHIGASPERIDALFGKYSTPEQWAEYKSFFSYDEKVISGVTATCKAALQIFNDEAVAKVTSFDTLDLQDFRKRKVALFIQNSVSDQRYYSVLTSIFFEQFFSYIMSRFPEEMEQDIFFLVDEASSLRLPTLQLAVANVRKHRAGIMLVVQDFNQIVHNYGKEEAEAIKSNCFAKLYFTGHGMETTKELESIMGKFEYTDKDNKKNIRSLMTSDEIRIMSADSAILIAGNLSPIKAKLKPYYQNWRMKSYCKIPAPVFVSELPFTSIPVLVLPEAKKKPKDNKNKFSPVKANTNQMNGQTHSIQ